MTTTVPVHPIQTPAELPAGSIWTDFGDGRWGARITGSGTAVALYGCRTIAMVESRSVMMSADIRSSLICNNNGFEGYGFGVCGLRREGNGTRVVSWNNPVASGQRKYWLTSQHADWERVHIPVVIPTLVEQPEFLDCSLIVRAPGGGVLDVDLMGVRAHYFEDIEGVISNIDYIAGPFDLPQFSPMNYVVDWIQDRARTRLGASLCSLFTLKTVNTYVGKGVRIRLAGDVSHGLTWLTARQSSGGDEYQIPSVVGVGLKLYHTDSTVSFIRVCDYFATPLNAANYAVGSFQRAHQFTGDYILKRACKKIELLHYIGPVEDHPELPNVFGAVTTIYDMSYTLSIEDQVLAS